MIEKGDMEALRIVLASQDRVGGADPLLLLAGTITGTSMLKSDGRDSRIRVASSPADDACEANTMLPLWMYVTTSVGPRASMCSRRAGIEIQRVLLLR